MNRYFIRPQRIPVALCVLPDRSPIFTLVRGSKSHSSVQELISALCNQNWIGSFQRRVATAHYRLPQVVEAVQDVLAADVSFMNIHLVRGAWGSIIFDEGLKDGVLS